MFRTVGDEVQFVERVRESAVVDLPNVTGRDVVWRDSLGRLLTLLSWIEAVDEGGLGTANMLTGVDDSWDPARLDVSTAGVSEGGQTRSDLSASEESKRGGGGFIEMAIMVNRASVQRKESTWNSLVQAPEDRSKTAEGRSSGKSE